MNDPVRGRPKAHTVLYMASAGINLLSRQSVFFSQRTFFILFTVIIFTLMNPPGVYPIFTKKVGNWKIRMTGYFKDTVSYTEPGEYPIIPKRTLGGSGDRVFAFVSARSCSVVSPSTNHPKRKTMNKAEMKTIAVNNPGGPPRQYCVQERHTQEEIWRRAAVFREESAARRFSSFLRGQGRQARVVHYRLPAAA